MFIQLHHPMVGSPDLSRESSLWHLITVLCCNRNLCVKLLTGEIKVNGRGSANNLWRAREGINLMGVD